MHALAGARGFHRRPAEQPGPRREGGLAHLRGAHIPSANRARLRRPPCWRAMVCGTLGYSLPASLLRWSAGSRASGKSRSTRTRSSRTSQRRAARVRVRVGVCVVGPCAQASVCVRARWASVVEGARARMCVRVSRPCVSAQTRAFARVRLGPCSNARVRACTLARASVRVHAHDLASGHGDA